MKCPHCGQEHPDNTKFCPETGKKLEQQLRFCDKPDCNFRQPLPPTANFCPNCGKPLNAPDNNTFNNRENQSNKRTELSLFGIVLGKTIIQDLIDSGKFGDPDIGEEGECIVHLTDFVEVFSASVQSPVSMISSGSFCENIEMWNEILPFKLHDDISVNQIVAHCRKNRLNYKSDEQSIAFILPNSNMLVGIQDSEFIIISNLAKCSRCGSLNYQIEEITRYTINLRCRDCKKVFDFRECATDNHCPQCGSTYYTDDGSGYMQYHCQDCQNIWGNEEEP